MRHICSTQFLAINETISESVFLIWFLYFISGSKDTSRLEKQLKGQLNRLAESNMQSISRLIEDMYARNSRNDMNECLVKILKSSILLPSALIPERLVMEHAMLIGECINCFFFVFSNFWSQFCLFWGPVITGHGHANPFWKIAKTTLFNPFM